MTATTPIAAASAILLMALAGCTGGFQVDQTEPFRIQLEGAPETVTVRDSDAEPQKVVVETCAGDEAGDCDVEEIEVQFEVTQVSSGPCKLLVTIQDDDGNTIATKVIEVNVSIDNDDDDTSGNGTSGNGTTTVTETRTETVGSGQTVTQNIVVNVKGSKNIVVLTQAQQGSADVTVNAVKASGNADVDVDGDDETSSASTTTTAASPGTASASSNTTGP